MNIRIFNKKDNYILNENFSYSNIKNIKKNKSLSLDLLNKKYLVNNLNIKKIPKNSNSLLDQQVVYILKTKNNSLIIQPVGELSLYKEFGTTFKKIPLNEIQTNDKILCVNEKEVLFETIESIFSLPFSFLKEKISYDNLKNYIINSDNNLVINTFVIA